MFFVSQIIILHIMELLSILSADNILDLVRYNYFMTSAKIGYLLKVLN